VAKVCKVLVVEDNKDIRNLLGEVFKQEGYHFTLVADGDAMRRALAAGDVDVVILDMVLRGPNAGMLLAEEAAARGCAIILVTGSNAHYDAVEKSGHRYMFKPYRLAALLQLVDEVLKASKARCVVKKRTYGEARAP
jgi:DNA-binding NtrC family response regulator